MRLSLKGVHELKEKVAIGPSRQRVPNLQKDKFRGQELYLRLTAPGHRPGMILVPWPEEGKIVCRVHENGFHGDFLGTP